MENNQFYEAVNQLLKLKEKIQSLRIDLAKHFVSASSAFLALIVAFVQEEARGNLFFVVVFSTVLLSILASSTFLIIALKQFRSMEEDWQEYISKLSLGLNHNKTLVIASKYDNLLSVCEWVYLFSFILSVLLIVIGSFIGCLTFDV
ncbi:hypothetical protein [Ornithobacterium rhinotracheale]|uniref:Uncharacterized protein n=1 Tax=Ornithobacterium rhinotracheale (strain ATCC 51463 / DSM 15997 / CCUG 23171 / CIP 104009 / LMG 9086) TaxID=867902 RepID=I4A372_ORNRL|nr:hypothetical protein [Ornithobacterium rhinotracheale]AFL98406.1 hypothetical protein Ornrh_2275 [Ornithobacterium rhinotracheale DSM 15997]AIQ00760.1 hypothetical protein Q785_11530 [Ornithobacterium rhinotracheale ORT-UMN 88]KGB65855.1 hypothetical protein Q787_11060 [Ornithobacterium rhinotracheale H06-030791]MCK0193245.1 hypothetical protein [Ornithobacterium rhinotracheale]MCK0201118.1 hypothetical protein [Ornithobacterium rhinotracheale]